MQSRKHDIRNQIICSLTCALTTVVNCGGFAQAQTAKLDDAALEAGNLLNIQPEVEKLVFLKSGGSCGGGTEEELQLQSRVIKRTLVGTLEVRSITDEIDAELSSEYTTRQEAQARA